MEVRSFDKSESKCYATWAWSESATNLQEAQLAREAELVLRHDRDVTDYDVPFPHSDR